MQSTTSISLYASLTLAHLLISSSAIANQESLSGIETEMRKLEGLVKEIVDELDYLKKREERFANTNGTSPLSPSYNISLLTRLVDQSRRISACKTLPGSRSSHSWVWVYGRFSTFVPSLNASTLSTEQCYNVLS